MLPEWVGVVGGILGIIGMLSVGLVYAKGRIASDTISLLNQNQDAQSRRIETLETENRILRDRVNALEHTKDELFEQVKSLPAFIEMTDTLDRVNDTLGKYTKQMERIVRTLDNGE